MGKLAYKLMCSWFLILEKSLLYIGIVSAEESKSTCITFDFSASSFGFVSTFHSFCI